MGCRKLKIQDYFTLRTSQSKPTNYTYAHENNEKHLTKIDQQLLVHIQTLLKILSGICELRKNAPIFHSIIYTYDTLQDNTTKPFLSGKEMIFSKNNVTTNACRNSSDDKSAANYKYSPFSKLTISTKTMDSKFTSYSPDNKTNLVYYGYRYYDANMGRWINRDPAEEEGGLNLYGFVGNDGINKLDYLGMAEVFRDSTQKYACLSTKKGESLESVAKVLKLDNNDALGQKGWLYSDNNGTHSSSYVPGDSYFVPNIWVAADLLRGSSVGRLWVGDWAINFFGGTIGTFVGTDIFTQGFKIEKPTTGQDIERTFLDNSGAIWGMVLFAHCNPWGAVVDGSGQDRYMTQRKLLGLFDDNGYKLAKFYNMPCFSGFNGKVTLKNISKSTTWRIVRDTAGIAKNVKYHAVNRQRRIWNLSFNINWKAEWEKRVVKSGLTVYQGVNALAIDFRQKEYQYNSNDRWYKFW